MNRSFRHVVVVGAAVVAAGTFAACSSDDDAPAGTVEITSVETLVGDDGLSANVEAAAVIVGMSEADATAELESLGLTIRVIERDGELLAATADFRPERINVAVEDGSVTVVVSAG